ncbi:MAG: acetyl-CoA carboxylase biotin carboxyl carrier protein subunit [Acidobacteria bacterium]|nr:acetyl-CoA carboxylase biotin carboxyl carrier protein subunit [Acidobacteriota bacterium]
MKLNITIDGKKYDVEVEVAEEERPSSGPYYYVPPSNPVSLPSAAPPPLAAGPAAGGAVDEAKVCRSPIAGVVVKINAQAGQQIQVNDPLVVLEAMKMETNITSPVSGKIKAMKAAVGEAVQNGQILVEFE